MLRFILVVACLFFLACQKKSELTDTENNTADINLYFSASAGTDSLVAGNEYLNDFNEPYSVTTCKFYLHNLQFLSASGEANPVLTQHFLVDLLSAGSHSINITYPAGNYTGLRLTLGVDSARNVSGAQTDALDPARGMFWTWNSGYIMAKLEGYSSVANTPDNKIEYHIGGFKKEESVIRTIQLSFPDGTSGFSKGSHSVVRLNADLNSWFKGESDIHIAEHPVITTPGELAVQMADNYQHMFSIPEVKVGE